MPRNVATQAQKNAPCREGRTRPQLPSGSTNCVRFEGLGLVPTLSYLAYRLGMALIAPLAGSQYTAAIRYL